MLNFIKIQVRPDAPNLFQPSTCTILSRRRFTVILQVTCNLAYSESDYGPTALQYGTTTAIIDKDIENDIDKDIIDNDIDKYIDKDIDNFDSEYFELLKCHGRICF